FSGAARPNDEHRSAFGDVTPGGQVMHQCPVQIGQLVEVEGVQRLGGAEGGAPQSCAVLLLFASRDFIFDQQGKEFGIGQFAVDGLPVARFERVQDAREA